MFNLSNTTFIIPLFIESDDRYNNAKSVLGYLNSNFKTNVIIHEFISNFTKLDFLSDLKNLNIKHIKEINLDDSYHRTRQLNEMLKLVKTPVVCNYDIDIILPIESYLISEYTISNNIYDVIYPYGFGEFQYQVLQGFDRNLFNNTFNISDISDKFLNKQRSEYGHCIFFNTDKYKSIGGENENFISYGPEDIERYERCVKFDLKLHRIKNFVYHFEHGRTKFSNKSHENYLNNEKLYSDIKNKNQKELFEYYSNLNYLRYYNFKLNIVNNSNNITENSKTKIEKIDKTNEIVYTPPIIKKVDICYCGEPKNRVKYNFCQKCNKLY